MMHRHINTTSFLLMTMSVAVLAGCSSVATTAQQKQPAFIKSRVAEVPSLGKLSVNNLPDGKCGLLLWTLNANKPALVFRHVVDGETSMVFDDKETALEIIDEAGLFRYGFGTYMEYNTRANNAVSKVTVSFDYGLVFEGGNYIKKGTISVVKDDGWERITPVAGIAGCRA